MNFRQDINGLRAWAVIAVVLFHFDIAGAQGGFAGVDVFFVISGYLMTEIIFRRIQVNSFSLISFYLDRSKRIIPALIALCIALLAIGWIYWSAYEYRLLAKHVWGSAGFFSNYIYLGESGYFEKSAVTGKWLQHTWSLSVEWQFYILYPLLIIAFTRARSLQKVKYGILLFATLSFGYCFFLSIHSADTAFYILPTRIWELLAGALVYFFPITSGSRQKRIMEWIGFALILYSFNQMNNASWPGWHALFPVCGTALILLAGRQESFLTSNALAQWIGTTSYSIYLFHWPIAYLIYTAGLQNTPAFVVAGIVITIALGAISWRFIEKPFQRRNWKHPWLSKLSDQYALATILSLSLLVCQSGYLIWQRDGLPERSQEIKRGQQSAALLEKNETMHKGLSAYYHFECGFFDEVLYKRNENIAPSCTQNITGKIVFLWGDSHAQALSTGLRTLLEPRFSVAQIATSQCTPTLTEQWEKPGIDNNCDFANKFALQEIARLKPEYIVLAQQHMHEHTDWDALANKLKLLGAKNIILVGPVPQWDPSLPMVVLKRHWLKEVFNIHDDGLVPDVFETNRLLHEKYDTSSSLRYVSMIDTLCKNKTCLTEVPGDGELLVMDYGHLTPKGSIYAAKTALGNVLIEE